MRQTFEVLYFAWLTVLPLPESLALSPAIPHSLQLATQKRTRLLGHPQKSETLPLRLTLLFLVALNLSARFNSCFPDLAVFPACLSS